MGLYTPAEYLLAPLADTVASGATEAVSLGGDVSFVRVKRLASSAGSLLYVLSNGTVATPYTLTEADPDSGWMPVSDTIASIKASGGDVDYEIARIGRP